MERGIKEIVKQLEDGSVRLLIDKSVYHHDPIISTTYKYTKDCYINVDTKDSEYYSIYFTTKKNVDLIILAHEFCNELIDQQLRYNLDQSNKSIKELIIRKAFFPFSD